MSLTYTRFIHPRFLCILYPRAKWTDLSYAETKSSLSLCPCTSVSYSVDILCLFLLCKSIPTVVSDLSVALNSIVFLKKKKKKLYCLIVDSKVRRMYQCPTPLHSTPLVSKWENERQDKVIANQRFSHPIERLPNWTGRKPVQKNREMIKHQNRRLLWERKLDVLYFIFFVIHLPVMLGMIIPFRKPPRLYYICTAFLLATPSKTLLFLSTC